MITIKELLKNAIDLGFENGWTVTPEIVDSCTHKKDLYRVGSVKYTSCTECNYVFKTDSSD